MQPTVIWKIICALSGIYAIRESDSNASKTVLEKLMGASQNYTGGRQTSQADQFAYSLSLSHEGDRCPGPTRVTNGIA
jgi:hypothetical protein